MNMLAIGLGFLVIASVVIGGNGQQECSGPPPVHINPQHCCNHPKFIDDRVFINCIRDFQRPKVFKRQSGFQTGPPQGSQHCIGDCVFKSLSMIVENAIDEKAVLGYIGNALALTPEWIPILTEGFNKCNKELIIRSNEFKYKQGDCLAGPGFIMGCLHSHVIQFCPKNVWNSSAEDCQELKEFFIKCPFPPKHNI